MSRTSSPTSGGPTRRTVVAASLFFCFLTPSMAGAQCAGDCDAGGQVTVDELITMIAVGLGEASPLACAIGDANVDGVVTVDEIIGGVANALAGCSAPVRRSFDFRGGRQGWEADFADFTPEMVENLELDAGPRTLPPELGLAGPGFVLSGFNQSDDLFMSLSRRLTVDDGIEPNRAYLVEYTILFASDAPTGCIGVGGAPGESVYLKAGATPFEPEAELDPADGHVRMNVDKGNQGQDGPHASLAGNVANGLPCEPGNETFVSLRREHRHLPPVIASAAGDLWLLIGTDSGYEGRTTLYYQRVDVKLTPVDDLELNDVSALLPLPEVSELDDRLSPTDFASADVARHRG